MTGQDAARRQTRQRAAVLQVLTGAAGFRSAQQLHADLCECGVRIGLATVYRTLQWLAERGDIDVVRMPDGERCYRRCRLDAHHHHLVCRWCGRVVEVQGLGVDVRAQRLAAEHGFSDVVHTVDLVGTCATCAGDAASDDRAPT